MDDFFTCYKCEKRHDGSGILCEDCCYDDNDGDDLDYDDHSATLPEW